MANVDKRLDTRPPGAELTPLGREQARAFAQAATSVPGLLLHSVATRAVQTAAEISAVLDVPAREVTGIHEVQVGDLEGRNDDDAVDEFNAVYRRWLKGERDVSMPGGENANQVLDRYLPVLTELRTRYLDEDDWTSDIVVVSHGAAIRLTAPYWPTWKAVSRSTIIWPTPRRWSCRRPPTGVGVARSGEPRRRRSIRRRTTVAGASRVSDPMG